MQPGEQVRDILMMEFIGIQSRNPGFSMRAYAKKIGIPQSAVSEIVGKRRKVTAKMATKILRGLDFAPAQISEVVSKFDSEIEVPQNKSSCFRPLDMDSFRLISEWYHFAILSLTETKSFKSNTGWMARRLGISESLVQSAVERLIRLEMLRVDAKTKKLIPTGVQYQFDPGIATPALKKACRENLELSNSALDWTNYDQRDFTAITFCFDPKKMVEAKRMIKSFRRKFCTLMESGTKTEVYKLCLQLFPLTKTEI